MKKTCVYKSTLDIESGKVLAIIISLIQVKYNKPIKTLAYVYMV